MKKALSIFIALLMIVLSTMTAFATETDELITNEQYYEFEHYIDDCEEYYIYYYRITPPANPTWSNKSTERMKEAVAYARERVITTKSQLDDAYADMQTVINTMCVDIGELEFMIYLFENETNINNYYDEKTWSEFQSLLEKAKLAYESDNEEFIHDTYIEMRNSYNDLCTYNTLKYDFNGDGVFNVLDTSYAHKYLVGLVEFNSSQLLLSEIGSKVFSGLTIERITDLQKYMVGLATETKNVKLDELVKYEGLSMNTRRIGLTDEQINPLYYQKQWEYFHPNPNNK